MSNCVLEDFEGNLLSIGNEVLFSISVWDCHNVLKRGVVVEEGYNTTNIRIQHHDTWWKYNEETGKHDIPNPKVFTDYVNKESIYKLK